MRIFFYGLVRVVVFVALWALFYYVMDLGMIFGVIAATILTFAVSYLFLVIRPSARCSQKSALRMPSGRGSNCGSRPWRFCAR